MTNPIWNALGSIRQHDLVESLVEEFRDRQQRGEHPTIEEYDAQHPELAEELRELLEAVAVVQDLKLSSRDATGSLDGPAPGIPGSRPLEQVGDDRILREIGHGGMGIVYEAEQESLGRRVAWTAKPHCRPPAYQPPDPALDRSRRTTGRCSEQDSEPTTDSAQPSNRTGRRRRHAVRATDPLARAPNGKRGLTIAGGCVSPRNGAFFTCSVTSAARVPIKVIW